MRQLRRWAALCSLGFVVLFTQPGQGATATDPFTFFTNIVLTGDYIVSGGPTGASQGGFAQTTFAVSGVPAGATAVAAYLYWGAVVAKSDLTAGKDAFFRAGGDTTDHDISSLTRIQAEPRRARAAAAPPAAVVLPTSS